MIGATMPRLSPDGARFAFFRIEPDGSTNVWTQALDGGPARQITSAVSASFPAWSPDGRWLAVELEHDADLQLGIVPADGGSVEELTTDPGLHFVYSWAPDGDRLTYAGERDSVWNIYTMSRRTREITALTHFTSPNGYVRYPVWSPQGDRVAFERAIDNVTLWTVQVRSRWPSVLPQRGPRIDPRGAQVGQTGGAEADGDDGEPAADECEDIERRDAEQKVLQRPSRDCRGAQADHGPDEHHLQRAEDFSLVKEQRQTGDATSARHAFEASPLRMKVEGCRSVVPLFRSCTRQGLIATALSSMSSDLPRELRNCCGAHILSGPDFAYLMQVAVSNGHVRSPEGAARKESRLQEH